jgi:hypothetical protein
MDIRRLRPALVLSAWTLLIWTTRIRNIWTDDSLSVPGQLWRTALALVFTAFAAVTVGAWAKARRDGASVIRRTSVWIRAFALWTVGVWLVRGTQIVLGDHSLGFVVVHSVLAVVSVALAVWADRAADRSRTGVPIDA